MPDTNDPIAAIRERLSKATPGPWQQGHFVDGHRYNGIDDATKNHWREQERETIRGTGDVGTPGCNVVARVKAASCDDYDAILHSWSDIRTLLDRIKELERERDEARINFLNAESKILEMCREATGQIAAIKSDLAAATQRAEDAARAERERCQKILRDLRATYRRADSWGTFAAAAALDTPTPDPASREGE